MQIEAKEILKIIKKTIKERKKLLSFIGVLLLGFVFLNYLNKATFHPRVDHTNPTTGATNVALDSSVKIVFEKDFKSSAQKESLHIRFTPGIVFTQIWQDDKTLTLSPPQPFTKNTEYTVDVVYSEKDVVSFSFKTAQFTDADILEHTREQSKLDYEFASETKDRYVTSPWQKYLPVEGEKFSVVYDYEKEAFNIWLDIASTAPDAEKSRIRVDSVAALREMLEKIDLSLSDFSYYYVYNDD